MARQTGLKIWTCLFRSLMRHPLAETWYRNTKTVGEASMFHHKPHQIETESIENTKSYRTVRHARHPKHIQPCHSSFVTLIFVALLENRGVCFSIAEAHPTVLKSLDFFRFGL
jgi:hypothetical protein